MRGAPEFSEESCPRGQTWNLKNYSLAYGSPQPLTSALRELAPSSSVRRSSAADTRCPTCRRATVRLARGRRFAGIQRNLCKISVDMQLDYESDPPPDDAKTFEKESTLNGAVSQLASDFDRDSNLSLERFSRTRRASVISTGSLKLDLALGIGGLPKDRMVEIFGKESSGKTTLALHVVKEAQKNGGYCAYIDAENAFNTSVAEAIGVDIDKLLIAQPDSAENSLSIVNTLVGGFIDVVVVDSVAALLPKCELEGEIHMKFADLQSRLMTWALRKIQYTLSRSETLIIFVNQVRTRRDPFSGLYKETTCGGNALGFYSAVRMRTSRRKLRYSEDQATGIGISVEIIKNKLAPATLKEAGIDIRFGRGI
ncbi:hypothetical protein ACQ4PT_026277 [Festuca glaucescens]